LPRGACLSKECVVAGSADRKKKKNAPSGLDDPRRWDMILVGDGQALFDLGDRVIRVALELQR